jgi:tetratricopeptide (TPR) repeat protein
LPRTIPPPLSLALIYIRRARGWTQQDLAAAAGVMSQVITDYEQGIRRTLTRETLDDLVVRMGCTPEDATLALLFLAGLPPPADEPRLTPIDPTPSEVRRARQIAARLGLTEANRARCQILDLARTRRVEQARRKAAAHWESLRPLTPEGRRQLVESSPGLWSWALVERLCDESIRAAADDAGRALELARLALRVAALVPGGAEWRSGLEGYAWGFVANGQRVGSDLLAAEASFATAWRLWRAAGPAAPWPLGEWRLYDLEASLRRAQRQFGAALQCLNRALAGAPVEAQGRILLNKQTTHEQAGDIQAALSVLEEAAPLVDTYGGARDRQVVRFNLVVILCHLGRYDEAAARLPELRETAVSLGNRLDLTRVLWLSGRVAAGQGRRDEARAAFKQVRKDCTDHLNGYDAALVSLDLALLYLEVGDQAEVAVLAEEMVWIFRSRCVRREALAALGLFCQAAKGRSATLDLTRQVIDYLERARRDPQLRFEVPG